MRALVILQLVLLLSVFSIKPASADIYVYKDQNGVLNFTPDGTHPGARRVLNENRAEGQDSVEAASPKGHAEPRLNHGGVYCYRDSNGVITFTNTRPHDGYRRIEEGGCSRVDEGNYRQTTNGADGIGGKAVIGMVVTAVIFVLFLVFRGDKERKSTKYGFDSSSSGYTSSRANADRNSSWPWHGREIIFENKNVYEKGTISNSKVGSVRENIWGEKIVQEESIFTSEKVGKVETTVFGTPKSVVDNDGNKVGDIKTTWTGRTIVVDADGNEIGEYKDIN